jgi:glycosyltransferase involved in cell wall biosynthesis
VTLRVVHWFPNFLAGGGVANSVFALGSAQSSLGADVHVVSLEHESPIYGPMETRPGMHVEAWNGRSMGLGGLRLHVPGRTATRALRTLQPDVVHVHAEFNPDNWWTPRLWRCPLVLTPHGAFHTAVVERGARRKRLYRAVADALLYRKVARFHALSAAEQADIVAVLPRARSYVVFQGPSPGVVDALGHGRPTFQVKARAATAPVRLMFCGRIDVRTKGLDVLVEAFARAIRDGDIARPATLALVGPDVREGKLQMRGLADRLGVGALVEIRQQVPQEEIPALFEGCDVYVQLSRNEGSPMSLNDALVLGKPVIVSDRIGTVSSPEIAKLPHVRVVRPVVSEAAQAIADTVQRFDALCGAARAANATLCGWLSWDGAASRHLKMYEALLAGDRAT